jgi:hypothetical protein
MRDSMQGHCGETLSTVYEVTSVIQRRTRQTTLPYVIRVFHRRHSFEGHSSRKSTGVVVSIDLMIKPCNHFAADLPLRRELVRLNMSQSTAIR